MKSNFNRSLIISFGISLFLLLITSVASYISIHNLLSNAERVQHSRQVIQQLEETLSVLKDAETGQRGYLLTEETEYLEPYNGASAKTTLLISNLRSLVKDDPEQLKSVSRLEDIIFKRLSRLQKLIIRKNNKLTVDASILNEGKSYMDDARQTMQEMTEREDLRLQTKTATMDRFASFTPILIILAAIFAIIITLSSFFQIRRAFKKRAQLQWQLEQKDADLSSRIEIIRNLSNKIADGDYSIRLDDAEKDGLGNVSVSLNKMAESLDQSFKNLSDKEWQQTGIAELNDIMLGDLDLPDLSGSVTEFLSTYTGSEVGAFYLMEDPDNLILTGSYTLRINEKNQHLRKGEGVAGQCAQSGKPIVVTDMPPDAVYISYASGEARPSCIAAIPVYHDNIITGVIELASLTSFTPSHLQFLKSCAHNIGIAVASCQNRKKLQELLEETQSQAEELQAQHGEMESLNAELEAYTHKLQASEEELRVQQEDLLKSNQDLEERTNLLEEQNQVIEQSNKEIQRKAEELALSTKYKSEFLANMSHELRTPLNSILLLSRLMSENKDQHLTSEEVSYAAVIRSSGEGLLNLIDEILDLSKIEAGKMDLDLADISIKEVLGDMYALFTPLAAEKDLELKTHIGLDTPLTIRTDKMRLEQILKNLISNALKFTSKGYISLDIALHPTDPAYINFMVKDTGIGIAPEKHQQVFEAFQQEDGSTRRKYGGTGLGLSISRELTKLLKGEITLSSEQGKGTTFVVSIPIKETDHQLPESTHNAGYPASASKQDHKQVMQPTNGTPERVRFINPVTPESVADDRETIEKEDKVILIIEDDINFARALRNFIRKNGYKVLVAVSGDQGILLARHYKPWAILLDIILPIQDGWEVMDALKGSIETRHIPVHIMSSMEVKREGLQKGAIDYISKPFAVEQMREVFGRLENALTTENKKVLIIEENAKHAKALAYFLETFDVKSEIKDSVPGSVESLLHNSVNCVILDMGLPDKNAYKILETIKEKPGLESLPIIVFTGKSLSRSEEARIKEYADSIIVKTVHTYQRILDEVSLFLHLIGEARGGSGKGNGHLQNLGSLQEVLKNKKVLIADDDVRNIFSLTKVLEQYQMIVLSAINGKDALQQLAENRDTDLVLMDMMMPEMDGYETIARIRETETLKAIPIIAVTAKAMMGDREKCIEAGASDYISKPVDVDQLVSLLRVWLYDRTKK